MIGGRQLPSWMIKSKPAGQARISEIKEDNKEDGTEAVHNRACKPQKNIQRKQHDTGVVLLENKSHLIKKCEARSKKKLIKQDKDQGDDVDKSVQEKKVTIKAGKRFQQGDEQHLLNKCETSRRKRMSNRQSHDEHDDFYESDVENKIDIVARKRQRRNPPRKKKQKEKDLTGGSHDGITESTATDDEVTVEDLMSIAEEYMNAEKEKEIQKLQDLGFESEAKPLYTDTSKIGSKKDLGTIVENRICVADKSLSTNSSMMKPLLSVESVSNPINTGDPARDMLDLFLGPLLKTSEKVEREANVRAEKLMLDHELSQRSQNDTVREVAPVLKKKSSLRDKVAMLLD